MVIVEQNRRDAVRKIKTGMEEEVVKEEVTKILSAIGLVEHVDVIKLTRFKENGPILIACEELEVKTEILRKAKELRNKGYTDVYINNDLTESEAANEKRLRVEQKARNGALVHGTGFLKYGKA
ncbi:hypothetical protein BpHYR1_015233, partial [Brachionus plicatilis]